MALTSPKMGLNIWNLLTDPYDHAQLADNWSKVDFHDHTPGRGVQIPTEGIADGAVTAAKLASSLDPSLVYSTYKMETRGRGYLPASATNSLYAISLQDVSAQVLGVSGNAAATVGDSVFYFDPADYAVASKTVVLRLRAWVAVNTQAPSANFTFGLYPVSTIAGLSSVYPNIATNGAVVSGSTIAINSPSALTNTLSTGTDFTAPAAGYYFVGVTPSTTVSSTSRVNVMFDLQVRQT